LAVDYKASGVSFVLLFEALEILQGYAMQKGDNSGKACKAIDAYQRYFSNKLMEAPHQTRLPDLFARQSSFAD
jgi:hypothetical protein